MSNRKSSVFYGILIAFSFTAMGMVLASRFGLTPASSAGPINIPGDQQRADYRGARRDDLPHYREGGKHPAVVSITAFSQRKAAPDVSEMFQFPGQQQQMAPRRRGGQQQQPETHRSAACGSGFIIDKANGYILTNNHVIEGANDIRVRFFDNDPVNDPEGQLGQGRRPRRADRQRADSARWLGASSRTSRRCASATRRSSALATG